MENILGEVDFDTHSVYAIQVNMQENDIFLDGKEKELDEHGQSMDVVSDLRRTLKYSYPFENKKIIKSIIPQDQKEDSNGNLCRDINLEYYLLVDKEEMEDYIYGSADVVGLMCLKVFVNGDTKEYDRLKDAAMRLGSAFQKVNFLRDLKQDYAHLNRTYFPNIDPENLTTEDKNKIIYLGIYSG